MRQKEGKLICCVIEKRDKDFSTFKKNQLALVPYRDIAAVVHGVRMQDWEEIGKEELDSRLLWYQKVNVDLLRHHTMVPLRFGNISRDTDDIKDFLARTYLHIEWALNRVRGRAEFVVQLSWDLKAALEEIAQGWKGKLDCARALEGGKALFEGAEEKRKILVDEVHQRLFPLAVDFADGKRVDESMLMNRSYLVEKEKESFLDEAMEELGRENKAYLSFHYIGPIPAYSFVPLKFNKGNFDLIDEARKILGLPQKSSFGTLRKIYRELSLKYHPDRNPDHCTAEERFKKISEAYDVLRTYCSSLGEHAECSFAKKDVERAFIVR